MELPRLGFPSLPWALSINGEAYGMLSLLLCNVGAGLVEGFVGHGMTAWIELGTRCRGVFLCV